MNDSIYRINLDIHTVGSQVFLPVKRGDTARTILIRLTEGYKSYQIADGCSARFCGKKPDGNHLYNDCTISGGIITYNLTSQTTACEGVVECEIQLFDADGKQITSPRFSLVVDGTLYNGEDIASTPEADSLKELTDRAEEIVNQYDEGIIVGKGYVDNNFANALKGSASRKVVAIKDVSPIQHDVKVKATPVVVAETDLSAGGSVTFDPISNWVVTTSLMWEYIVFTFADGTHWYSAFSPNELGGVAKYIKAECKDGVCTFYYYDDEAMTSLWYFHTVEGWNKPLVGVGSDEDDIHIKVEALVQDSVNIKVYGKNLYKPTGFKRVGGSLLDEFSVQEDGSIKIVGNVASFNYALLPNPTLPAGTYTFKGTDTNKFIYYVFTLQNGVQKYWSNGTFTLKEGDTIQYLQVRDKSDVATEFNDVINVQIEVGSTATDYEPYIEPAVYTPDADGKVELVSRYPSMTFMTDADGVNIGVEYNRDINKAFQELQQVIAQLQTLAVATIPMNEEV